MTIYKTPLVLALGLLLVLLFGFHARGNSSAELKLTSVPCQTTDKSIKIQAFRILDIKCNSCHRKRNPFMIFSEKNMSKRAEKINKQVFELKRMPKKEGKPLSEKEYQTLKIWIQSQ